MNEDEYVPSNLEQRKQFESDLSKARQECEKAGVGWPGWYWSDGVELVGQYVMFDGDLYKVMSKTFSGFYGDAIHYDPESKRADEKGFVHCMGLPIPRAYDPFKTFYTKKDEPKPLPKTERHVQMSLFDF